MGGRGSGNHFGLGLGGGGKPTTDRYRPISVYELGLTGEASEVSVETIFPAPGGKGRHRQAVSVNWTPCHYGGHRPWFLCPRTGCGRRCAMLFSTLLGVGCRKCLGLTYQVRNESEAKAQARKADKLKRKLGWKPGDDFPFLGKPFGMRWETFERLRDQISRLELASMAGALSRWGPPGAAGLVDRKVWKRQEH